MLCLDRVDARHSCATPTAAVLPAAGAGASSVLLPPVLPDAGAGAASVLRGVGRGDGVGRHDVTVLLGPSHVIEDNDLGRLRGAWGGFVRP